MFFPGSEALPMLDVEGLLAPFFLLDKTKFKDGKDGDACFNKYSNEGHGVLPALAMDLNCIASAIRGRKFIPVNWSAYVDLFTLLSNHLDQQRFDTIHPKLMVKEKEGLVLNYLEAAFTLSPKIDYDHLKIYKPQYLSSHAQLLHYLGKARRYAGVGPEDRLPLLSNAFKIATYLSSLGCTELEDPHAYQNRIPTYELPVCYCLQDLKRFNEAAALILPQLSLPSAFHVTQARVQLANIYLKKHQEVGAGIDDALLHAHHAVEISKESGSSLLMYNARVCLMDTLQVAGNREEASEIAHAIVTEMDINTNTGGKPTHREAAQKILDANRVDTTASLSM